MVFIYEIKQVPPQLQRPLRRLLPSNFRYSVTRGKGQLTVSLGNDASEDYADQIVQRECDLFGFLTRHLLSPQPRRNICDSGVSIARLHQSCPN
jgi:hypothetical protein